MRRQRLQIVKLLQMAVTNMPAGLVPFPDQGSITRLLVFFSGVDKGCIPAPGIGSGEPDAALKQIHGGLVAHAATGLHVVVVAVA